MMTFREQKRAARRDLHRAMAEPVLYLKSRTDAPVGVTVRLHLQFELIGDLENVRAGFGERREVTPSIVFLNDQGVEPRRDGYVVTKDMGVYVVDNVAEPNDITTEAYVIKVEPATAAKHGWDVKAPWCGLPAPEGA